MITKTNSDLENNIFYLIKEIENLSIKNIVKESITYNDRGSLNEDQFFRNSSFDYFRSSSIHNEKSSPQYALDRNSVLNHEDDYFNDNMKKFYSKNHYNQSDFTTLSTLGSGAYSKVIKAKNKKTGEIVAIKITDKNFLEKEGKFYQMHVENEILNQCNHPNVIKILGCYEDDEKVYMVLEYCNKGSLAEFIHKNSPMELELSKFFLAQVLITIEYLASKNILHRDIKPHNLVIDKQFQLKLIDFSTSTIKGKIFDEEDFTFIDEKFFLDKINNESRSNMAKRQQFVGTAEYMSPEVINSHEIGIWTDLWSFGVLIYQCFMGRTPFVAKTEYLIFQNILQLKYTIDDQLVPEDAEDLIKNILKIDPKERLGSGLTEDTTMSKLKSHRFFNNFDTKKYLEILENFSKNYGDEKPFKKVEGTFEFERKNSQSEKQFEEFLKSQEKILKVGELKKRSPWYFYDKRKIILYNTPRIDYIDPLTNILKGSILLDHECEAKLIDSITFQLATKKRTFVFLCKKKFDISPWVTAINDAIKNYSN